MLLLPTEIYVIGIDCCYENGKILNNITEYFQNTTSSCQCSSINCLTMIHHQQLHY